MPGSRAELKAAIDLCIGTYSRVGDCAKGPHGPIGQWDVSAITDMSYLFEDAALFNSNISKWDVSAVKTMKGMFHRSTSFNIDISKWDVSSVINMQNMFRQATAFSSDISKWDVSSVSDMGAMFWVAPSFNTDFMLKHVSKGCVKSGSGLLIWHLGCRVQ